MLLGEHHDPDAEAHFGFQWVQTHSRTIAGQQLPVSIHSWYTEVEKGLHSPRTVGLDLWGWEFWAAEGRSPISCLSKVSLQSQVLPVVGNNANGL